MLCYYRIVIYLKRDVALHYSSFSAMDHSSASVRVYKYRFVILLLFCLYSAINFLQFLQYSIISNIVTKYYNVDSSLVDLTGLLFLVCFIVFCLPVNLLIERYNLRITALVSSGLTAVGNLLKLASVSPDRFYVVLISQFLCSVAQVFVMSVPSKLASTWFGPDEVSTACAVAILGTQIGVAIGCIFPAHLVKNSDRIDYIGNDLFTLVIINACVTCAIFILVVLFFRARPPLPPSRSQVPLLEENQMPVRMIVRSVLKNKNYLWLLLAFGSSNGMYSSFGITINTVYLHYFPNEEEAVGTVSALAVIAGGCFGSVFFGFILDKWHRFKLTSFAIIILSSVTYIFVALSMELKSQFATYFTVPIFGFFVASTLLVGFEFATELLYPIPEVISCSVLNAVIYLFSIIYSLIFSNLFDVVGYIAVHATVVILLFLSSITTYFISATLGRREANLVEDTGT